VFVEKTFGFGAQLSITGAEPLQEGRALCRCNLKDRFKDALDLPPPLRRHIGIGNVVILP
jgi:hypothetical protein